LYCSNLSAAEICYFSSELAECSGTRDVVGAGAGGRWTGFEKKKDCGKKLILD